MGAKAQKKAYTINQLNNMKWAEKFSVVDKMTRFAMMSKALRDMNKSYTYGQLQQLESANLGEFKNL